MTSAIPTKPPGTERRSVASRQFEPHAAMRVVLVGGGAILTIVTLLAILRSVFGLSALSFGSLPPMVQLHLATVMPCIPLGAWLFFAPKGTALHRTLGKIWCLLMLVTAISTLFIRDVNGGDFSFIHIFTAATLIGVPLAVIRARRGMIREHVRVLTGLYIGALLIAGGFAFFPGRDMWLMAFR